MRNEILRKVMHCISNMKNKDICWGKYLNVCFQFNLNDNEILCKMQIWIKLFDKRTHNFCLWEKRETRVKLCSATMNLFEVWQHVANYHQMTEIISAKRNILWNGISAKMISFHLFWDIIETTRNHKIIWRLILDLAWIQNIGKLTDI